MYVIGGTVAVLYAALWLASRREQAVSTADGDVKLLKPFYRIAMFLYKRAFIYKLPLFRAMQVKQDLQRLHPGGNLTALETEYYVKKLGLVLALLLAGTGIAVAVRVQMQGMSRLAEGGMVRRGDYSQEEELLVLEAEIGQTANCEVQITMAVQELSYEEAAELEKEFWQEMLRKLPGKNASLMEVREDLECAEQLEGYPFRAEWSSSHPEILSQTGVVEALSDEEGQLVVLSALVRYLDWEWLHETTVQVKPPLRTEEELLRLELEQFLTDAELESREEQQWQLPSHWKGENISWKEKREDNSLLFWAAVVAAGAGIYIFMDRDLHEKLEERKRNMLEIYPLILNKLVLYLGAGMTIRSAYQKIAGDYQRAAEEGRTRHPAYEEMVYTCREMQNGMAEGAAYERFGQRVGLQEYIRLSALLNQNLKKGSTVLLARLREEAGNALKEQENYRKKAGEEAAAKLLVPMMLLLGMVMVLVMIPAFSSLGI